MIMPRSSIWPMSKAACSALNPNSWNPVAFCINPCKSVPICTPVCCPTTFKESKSGPASDADKPNAAKAFCVWSTDVVTSVLFSFANFMNCPESVSSSFPVRPKGGSVEPPFYVYNEVNVIYYSSSFLSSRHSTRTAFCAWRRFSASSKISSA